MSDPSGGHGAGSGSPCLSDLLDAYRSYLEGERGLSPLTVHGYVQAAERFMLGRCAGDPARLVALCARDVSRFVLAESSRGLSPRTVNEVVVRLRSLLRYLYVKGLIDAPLAQATPWMAGSRAGSLPRALEPGAGSRLLAGCDVSTEGGLRDFAVLALIIRLGLRAREIVTLALDDIDWRSGEIAVRGKGQRALIGSRCRPTSARPWPPTSKGAWPTPVAERYSSTSSHPGVPSRQPESTPWCAEHAGGRGSPRPGRTGSAMGWRPNCSAPEPRCPRSASCCATTISKRPPSMPRSISTPL